MELTGAADDVLRFLSGIRVPAEAATRLDLVNDRGGRRRPVSSAACERTLPANMRIIFAPNFRSRELLGIDNDIHLYASIQLKMEAL
jgi:hypothetical protein